MNIKRHLSHLFLTMAVALPCAWPGVVSAQTGVSTSAFINSFGVEQVQRLTPGNVIPFSLDGTQGATVTVQIAGATAPLTLTEVRPGHYEGEYTVRQRDKLTSASAVTARVLKDGRATSASLDRSLVLGARSPVPTAQITTFNVQAPERVRPGDELNFSVTGTPGGQARVAVQGVANRISLTEVSRGVYEGNYVVRRNDSIRGTLVADAILVSDRRESRQHFESTLTGTSNDGDRRDRQQAVSCANCGVVESVNLVEIKGDSSNVIGTIAGGVLGGVVGNQVGDGRGQDLARILGAVGGAYAGNRVQNNMDKSKVHRVTVRLENGTTQTFDYADEPATPVGTRVKIENGVLIRL